MNKVVELFRKCKFSDLEILVRNGEGGEVVAEIETFDQCKFIAQNARDYPRLLECMSYTARSIADDVEKYLFAIGYSKGQIDKDAMYNGLKRCIVKPTDLVLLLCSDETRVYNYGISKINEVNYSFEEWVTVYDKCAHSAQLSILKRMLEVASTYEEKMWVFSKMSRGRQEAELSKIAEFLW